VIKITSIRLYTHGTTLGMDVCNRGGNTLNKKLSYVLVNLESVYGVYVKHDDFLSLLWLIHVFNRLNTRVWETFELNQLNSTPSQLLPVFLDSTGCKLVTMNLDRPISYIFFQVPANFFFIVMISGQELGH
jgi:hypothetical protein